jgi:NAD(P)-dependent dehydrogenase (short-subunit alcohol dehydrogenase family)
MRILVTGAARAIGAATVDELARRGHEVVATARDVVQLQGPSAAAKLEMDVADDASVASAIARAGELDAIVNNAAIGGDGPLESFPLSELKAIFETNLFGAVRVMQAVLPAWRARGSGVVVNVSSVQGKVGSPLESAYCATKWALEAMSESLHYEVGHFGIRVVIVEPGYTAPGMKPGGAYDGPEDYDELRRQWSDLGGALNPSGRPGPERVAAAISDAIETPSTPLRVAVGDDAQLVLGARAELDDAAFEASMRGALGLTW